MDCYVCMSCTLRIYFHFNVELVSRTLKFSFNGLFNQYLVHFKCHVCISRTFRILFHEIVPQLQDSLLSDCYVCMSCTSRILIFLMLCQQLAHFYNFPYQINTLLFCRRLFTRREVRIGKNRARGLGYRSRPYTRQRAQYTRHRYTRQGAQFFPIRTDLGW